MHDNDFDDDDYGYQEMHVKQEKRGRSTTTSTNRQVAQHGRGDKKPSFSHSGGMDDPNYAVFSNVENTLQSIDALVIPSSSSNNSAVKASPKMSAAAKKRAAKYEQSRPKMIHTQKMRVPVEDGKRKTKTLITRTAQKDARQSASSSSKSTRNSQRLSTVHHHIEQTIIKDEDFMSRSETEILLELSRKNLKYSPDVVNDLEEILRSPIKSRELNEEYITSDPFPFELMSSSTSTRPQRASARRSVVGQLRAAHQQSQKTKSNKTASESPKKSKYNRSSSAVVAAAHSSSHQELNHSNDQEEEHVEHEVIIDSIVATPLRIKHEQEEEYSITGDDMMFTCEMCSAVFRDRAQLLIHVPIHI